MNIFKFYGFPTLVLTISLLPFLSVAQMYPDRPIKVIVPFAPGGASDIAMRSLAPELSKRLGQPVFVENKAGANTAIGSDACAKAVPDGYTLCMLGIDGISINPFIMKNISYDSTVDFEPISMAFANVNAFIVPANSKSNSLDEFIQFTKNNPGQVNYGSPAAFVHIFMEGFNKTNSIDMNHIPYKGGGDVVKGILTNEIQIAFMALSNVAGLIQSNKVKVLAVDGNNRSALAPDAPTLQEGKFSGVPFRIWYGLFGPRSIPKAVVIKISSEFSKILTDPTIKERVFTSMSLEPLSMSLDQFQQFLKNDRLRSEQLVRMSGIKME